ncbi:response regulator [Balneolaceae bacterium ANBcel3]|nr:response regulator [Balneolaceae bacterium ANBcel3]
MMITGSDISNTLTGRAAKCIPLLFNNTYNKRPSGVYMSSQEHIVQHHPFMSTSTENSMDKTFKVVESGEKKEGEDFKIRALHIEDDDEIRFLVKAFLKKFANVDSVIDGYQAISHSLENEYDLIIADINLGDGMNGIEAVKEIKTSDKCKNIPVIAATAYGTSDIRTQCIEAGMDAFLLKPFMKRDLISTIEKVMEQH